VVALSVHSWIIKSIDAAHPGLKERREMEQQAFGRRIRGQLICAGDDRDAMTRLLQDGLLPDGLVVVQYDQQWPTMTKAREVGYVDADHYITDAGRQRLAKASASPSENVSL
jgi:hypothetical protein